MDSQEAWLGAFECVSSALSADFDPASCFRALVSLGPESFSSSSELVMASSGSTGLPASSPQLPSSSQPVGLPVLSSSQAPVPPPGSQPPSLRRSDSISSEDVRQANAELTHQYLEHISKSTEELLHCLRQSPASVPPVSVGAYFASAVRHGRELALSGTLSAPEQHALYQLQQQQMVAMQLLAAHPAAAGHPGLANALSAVQAGPVPFPMVPPPPAGVPCAGPSQPGPPPFFGGPPAAGLSSQWPVMPPPPHDGSTQYGFLPCGASFPSSWLWPCSLPPGNYRSFRFCGQLG